MPIPPAPPLPPAARPSARVPAPPGSRASGSLPEELLYPPPAFRFAVTFGSSGHNRDNAFREVSGLGPEMEIESVVEGGQNAFVHQLPKAIKHPRLVLSRGVAPFESGLVQWCRRVLESDLSYPIKPQLMHVFLLDADGKPLRMWSVINAYPVKWSVEAFQSTRNEVAIERIELACSGSRSEL